MRPLEVAIMMSKKIRYAVLCLAIAFVVCVAHLGSVIAGGNRALGASTAQTEAGSTTSGNPLSVQEEGVIRPEDLDEGLSINSLEDIRGRRVTVRQPIMEVVERGIVREPAHVLDDEYTLWEYDHSDDKPSIPTSAKIDFKKDTVFGSDVQLSLGDTKHPLYPMKGLARVPKNEATGEVQAQNFFSPFKKYMLLHQAWDFNMHYSQIIEAGQLKKHPAADYIYGKIPDDATAVKMHIVTDPIYRSPMTTGLYLAPGEVTTVKIKGLAKNETLVLYTHHEDTLGYQGYDKDGKGFSNMDQYLKYWDEKIIEEAKKEEPNFDQFSYGLHGQWVWQNQKVPCMGTTFTIVGTGEDMEVKIGSMYGGPLHVKPTQSSVDMEISGALLTPHFVLGVTTVEEFEEELRTAPGLIATLDVENGQLIGPAEDMRNADDIEKLAYFWHSVFAIDISLNGRDYNYNMTMCYDMHVPAGEAVALNSNFCAQPPYWFPICMNYERLTTSGNWGTFHELGHVQAKTHGVNWGFCDGDGEVWNNTLILLIYSMLCNMDSRLTYVEHGDYVHPYTAVQRSLTVNRAQTYVDKTTGETKKIDDYGLLNEGSNAHFDQLSMYATLLHSFGPDKFVDMFYTYKLNPKYCENKRADFVYRIGLVDRVNILDWVNDGYFANIADAMFTKDQLAFLRSLPTFVPVAYEWANGIDGHETARKRDVDGKHETVFDVSEEKFASPGHVEVVAVSKARYGDVEWNTTNETVTYKPPKDVTEYDQFDIIVRTESGRQVTLNVCMRLVYRGVYTEVWDLGSRSENRLSTLSPSIETAQNYVQGKDPTSTETGTVPGKGDFNHPDRIEYFKSTFIFRATKTGSHTFYVLADDQACVKFYQGKHGETGEPDKTIYSRSAYSYSLTDQSRQWTVDLNAGDVVFVSAELVNWGGKGNLKIGLCAPGQEYKTNGDIKDIPLENIINPKVSDDELNKVDREFKGWQPRFVDSIKNATIDYQNSETGWEVLYAPVSENGSPKENMVDRDEGTAYHSLYNHGTGGTSVPTPHVFVIDTKEDEEEFNYFDIIRRTNGNDKLTRYKLYGCSKDEYANTTRDGSQDETGWTLLFDGSSSNVNAARQRINFTRREIRYFKLIIMENSGHTVIKEVYAGITSDLSQTVKPSTYMTDKEDLTKDEKDGFVENSANGKLSTKKSGATFTFSFLGSGFEIYADTAEGYGAASVTVDGELQDRPIDLNDRKPTFNKLVFYRDGLETETHTVVITTDDKPFNISFINVKYGTPVAKEEYPATKNDKGEEDYGDTAIDRLFTREWRTLVKDYKTIESIKFAKAVPSGDYKDTYVRIDTYIRLYRSGNKIAFVYPGNILSPIECGSLFAGLEKLTEIDFANFDTTNLRGVSSMFYGCTSLENIDVSSFHTENVLSFSKMFGGCTSLTSIDLTNFKMDGNANIYSMFEGCVALQTIKLPNTIAQPAARVRRAQGEEQANVITCELPFVYQVFEDGKETNEFIATLVLNDSMKSKTLKVHKVHNFDTAASSAYNHLEVAPSCTEEGTIAYKTCMTCHCNFDYATGTVLCRDLSIPMTGHKYVYGDPEGWNYPTCTTPGGICTHECEYCGAPCPDDGGFIEYPVLGHSYELQKNEEHANGYTIEFIRYEEIEQEEMIDDEGKVYFTKEEKVVKGKAVVTFYLICEGIGDWEKFVQAQEADNKGDTETRDKLLNEAKCHHLTQVVFEFECDTHSDPTCTEAEAFFFEFSINLEEFTQAMIDQDTQDDSEDGISGFQPIVINKVYKGEEVEGASKELGHTFEDVAAIPATCTADGLSAGRRCTVCGAIEGCDEVLPKLGHDMKEQPKLEPTCTTAGHEAGEVCTRCGLEGQGVKHIDPLGHDFSVDVPAVEATCTADGLTAGKKCSRCDAVEGQDVVEAAHKPEVIPRQEPTATTPGRTEGLKCSVCGEILQEQQEIPATGETNPDVGGEGGGTDPTPDPDVGGGETPAPSEGGKGLSTAALAAIIAGVAVFIIAVVVIIVCTCKRKNRNKR